MSFIKNPDKKKVTIAMVIFLTNFIIFPFYQLLYANLSWTTKTSMPTARYDMAAGMVGGVIYVIGGDPGNLVPISTVEAYNPSSNSWATRTDMPYPMHRLAAAVIGTKIYTCGGWYGMGAKPYTFEYDPSTDSWTTKTPMPTGRYGHTAITVKDKIYVIGGSDGTNFYSTVEEYDPTTDTWATKTPMPTARAYLTSCVVRDTIYAIGGSNSTKAYLNIVEKYDPIIDNWSSETPMPTARRAPISDVVNDIIYVIGGDNGTELDINEAAEIVTNIEVTSFNATIEKGEVCLLWKTESESKTILWLIARSTYNSFSVIATLTANGSSPTGHTYKYIDRTMKKNRLYYYKLGAMQNNGHIMWYGPVSVNIPFGKTFLSISPNPFTERVKISFVGVSGNRSIGESEIKIYDVSGRLIRSFPSSLFTRRSSVTWDGRDELGKRVTPGIYFVKLRDKNISETQKLIFAK